MGGVSDVCFRLLVILDLPWMCLKAFSFTAELLLGWANQLIILHDVEAMIAGWKKDNDRLGKQEGLQNFGSDSSCQS